MPGVESDRIPPHTLTYLIFFALILVMNFSIVFWLFVQLQTENSLTLLGVYLIVLTLCVALTAALEKRFPLGPGRPLVKTLGILYVAFLAMSVLVVLAVGYGRYDVSYLMIPASALADALILVNVIFSLVCFAVMLCVFLLIIDDCVLLRGIIAIGVRLSRAIGQSPREQGSSEDHSEEYFVLSSMCAAVYLVPLIVAAVSQMVLEPTYLPAVNSSPITSVYENMLACGMVLVSVILFATLVADRAKIAKAAGRTLLIKPLTIPFVISLFQLMTASIPKAATGVIVALVLSVFVLFAGFIGISRLVVTNYKTLWGCR